MSHKTITATYSLYEMKDGEERLLETITEASPLRIITNIGMFPLVALERTLDELASGETFSTILSPAEAFGEYDKERVADVEKANLCVDGKFDETQIYPDAVIPLSNQMGEVYYAKVVSVGEDSVTVDFNHPLAGRTLKIVGVVVDSHATSDEEMNAVVNSRNCHCQNRCGEECERDCDKGGCCCGGRK